MEKTKPFIFASLFLIPLIFGIIFVDVASTFGYSDVPFVLGFFVYLLFVFIQRSTSKQAFALSLFFLLWMGLSYVPTGPGMVTERIGEWFYLFFIFGIGQYSIESWNQKSFD